VVVVVAIAAVAWWWSTRPGPGVDEPGERSEHGAVAPETALPRSEQPAPAPAPGLQPSPPAAVAPVDAEEPAAAEPSTTAEPSAARNPKAKAPTIKPKRPAPSPVQAPRPADGEECVALRAETEQAASSAAWTKVAKLTRRRECWGSQDERKRMRVRALFETQAWSACVDEGQGMSEPQVKQWVDLCQRHVD
jgi:hypothetical protein